MKYNVKVDSGERMIYMGDNFVYGTRKIWSDAVGIPLSLTLLRPRSFYDFDNKVGKQPLIIWICGGGWTEMDRKVWLPELVWFAKHGYAVASVDYSVTCRTRFPEPVEDIKQAIRWLRAHADEFNLDPDKFAVMGESAGGYYSAIAALVNDNRFDKGAHLDQSSAVQAAVTWYAPLSPEILYHEIEPFLQITKSAFPNAYEEYANLLDLVGGGAPPFLLLQGMKDSGVNPGHAEKLYEALERAGNKVDLYLIEEAEHADEKFIQEQTKEIILKFLDEQFDIDQQEKK